MNPEGLNRLRIAVVRRTVQDYLEALRVVHKHSGLTGNSRYYCNRAQKVILDCESFFRDDLDMFIDVDGMKLMETIQQRSWDPEFYIKKEEEKS